VRRGEQQAPGSMPTFRYTGHPSTGKALGEQVRAAFGDYHLICVHINACAFINGLQIVLLQPNNMDIGLTNSAHHMT
jgi:hypothetical protein